MSSNTVTIRGNLEEIRIACQKITKDVISIKHNNDGDTMSIIFGITSRIEDMLQYISDCEDELDNIEDKEG